MNNDLTFNKYIYKMVFKSYYKVLLNTYYENVNKLLVRNMPYMLRRLTSLKYMLFTIFNFCFAWIIKKLLSRILIKPQITIRNALAFCFFVGGQILVTRRFNTTNRAESVRRYNQNIIEIKNKQKKVYEDLVKTYKSKIV